MEKGLYSDITYNDINYETIDSTDDFDKKKWLYICLEAKRKIERAPGKRLYAVMVHLPCTAVTIFEKAGFTVVPITKTSGMAWYSVEFWEKR